MKLLAELPVDREAEGRFTVLGGEVDVEAVFGPVRCRGEADNANAAAYDNVIEDPTRVGGDHPYGTYRVVGVVEDPGDAHAYGPCFVQLRPVAGEALESWIKGRRGIGIHGGAPGAGGTLRATYGCLRLDDWSVAQLAVLLAVERAAGREVFYDCAALAP